MSNETPESNPISPDNPTAALVEKLNATETRLNSASTQLVKVNREMQAALGLIAEHAGIFETARTELHEAEQRFAEERKTFLENEENEKQQRLRKLEEEFAKQRENAEEEHKNWLANLENEKTQKTSEWEQEKQKINEARIAEEQRLETAKATLAQMQQMLSQFSNVFGGAAPAAAVAPVAVPEPSVVEEAPQIEEPVVEETTVEITVEEQFEENVEQTAEEFSEAIAEEAAAPITPPEEVEAPAEEAPAEEPEAVEETLPEIETLPELETLPDIVSNVESVTDAAIASEADDDFDLAEPAPVEIQDVGSEDSTTLEEMQLPEILSSSEPQDSFSPSESGGEEDDFDLSPEIAAEPPLNETAAEDDFDLSPETPVSEATAEDDFDLQDGIDINDLTSSVSTEFNEIEEEK